MSECVVRMEMPKGCWDCPCVNGEYGYCQADKEERQIEDPNERPSWCPIICQLPEGHGRLIDAEARVDERILNSDGNVVSNIQHTVEGILGDYAELIPTVVPAERSET